MRVEFSICTLLPFILSAVFAQSTDPCETVATQQSDHLGDAFGKYDGLIRIGVDPQTVGLNATTLYQCLTSVPILKDDALDYLKYAKIYGILQSDLAFIKQPTKAWQQPASDIMADLDTIAEAVKAGIYTSQYDFDADVISLARTANDYHFNLKPGILGSNMWAWSLKWQLTSFSTDGKELPKVYVFQDIQQAGDVVNLGWKPSAVATLDGKTILEYLSDLATDRNTVGVAESHTEWNIMMENAAYAFGVGATNDESLFTVSQTYPGEFLTGTFENGTRFTWEWFGYCKKDMTKEEWTSADNIYNKVVLRQEGDAENAEKRQNREFLPSVDEPAYIKYRPYYIPFVPLVDLEDTAINQTTSDKVPFNSYPEPTVVQEPFGKGQGTTSGYVYENESIAVISIPSFDVESAQNMSASFSQSVSDTLYEAKKSGVKKIVIDISGNGGGIAFQAYETFRRIFPDIYPYQLIRAQATDTLNTIGSAFDTIAANQGNIASKEVQSSAKNELAGAVSISSTRKFAADSSISKSFGSFSSWFGPVTSSNNGKYTIPARFDFTDPDLAKGMGLNAQVFGFGNNTVPKDYPRYAPEDVVLLTDGFCGSTCAVFAELMAVAAGVLTVSVGGTPTYGPMQYAAGTRGGNVYSWGNIDGFVEQLRDGAAQYPQLASKIGLTASKLAALPPKLADMKYADEGRNRVNVLDQVRAGDTSNTPLQFQYEPADCRLFYTKDMILDQSKVWFAAAKVASRDYGACVKGSTGQNFVVSDSPGFTNSFQTAVKGVWSANATWGSQKIGNITVGGKNVSNITVGSKNVSLVSNGSQAFGNWSQSVRNSSQTNGTVAFTGEAVTGMRSSWLVIMGVALAGTSGSQKSVTPTPSNQSQRSSSANLALAPSSQKLSPAPPRVSAPSDEPKSAGTGSSDVRLTQCPQCKRFADKYVEHDYVVLFIDLVLIKPQVYRHILFNRFYHDAETLDVRIASPHGVILPLTQLQPSIRRLGILLLLFDVYLTEIHIESLPQSSPAIFDLNVFVQWGFFVLVCGLASLSQHLTIRFLAQYFGFCDYPHRHQDSRLDFKEIEVLLSGTATPGGGGGSSATAVEPLKPPTSTSISTALLVSSCMSVFPIFMIVWKPEEGPSTELTVPSPIDTNLFLPEFLRSGARGVGWVRSGVTWAIALQNSESLRILLNCGYLWAGGLVLAGATARWAVRAAILGLVGLSEG
ncbi:uncharacterized protein KY384_003288 [Bacidia gigantensis]|uniref:uncharacterized protein n=1 Tax=Bacidia gigantensis TaxID=2732470 RepID=UPI001D03781F|nr:uncharacterized protein KY384_003288 [Bacidia gigantensis]KAG8531657.1 hypothetical protein KY384_003288 [Bacidia gigantensis]